MTVVECAAGREKPQFLITSIFALETVVYGQMMHNLLLTYLFDDNLLCKSFTARRNIYGHIHFTLQQKATALRQFVHHIYYTFFLSEDDAH